MARQSQLPRGVQILNWKNADGTKSISYRVRIVRKDLKVDRSFSTLEEAREFLALSKFPEGIGRIKKQQRLSGPGKFSVRTIRGSSNNSLKSLMIHYFEVQVQRPNNTPTNIRYNKCYRSLVNSICDTPLLHNPLSNWKEYERYLSYKLGRESIFEITEYEIAAFINSKKQLPHITAIRSFRKLSPEEQTEERWKSLPRTSDATIERQLTFLSAFFNGIREIDNSASFESIKNPVTKSLKRKVKTIYEKREVRLEEETAKKLFSELEKFRNPQMMQIVKLALATGCRRNEILNLRWSQVHENYISLSKDETKTKRSRKVLMLPQVRQVIESIEKIPGKDNIFDYTPEGFSTNWQRIVKRAGIKDFQFRDLRSEFISSLLDRGLESILVAELANSAHQPYFDKQYYLPHQQNKLLESTILGQDAVRASVGHTTRTMTRHYYRTKMRYMKY